MASIQDKLQIKELELHSLFETIRAINDNASEDNLYKIYKFTVRSNQLISKLALYVFDEQWSCKTYFGTQQDYTTIELNQAILDIEEIKALKGVADLANFEEFSTIIPVKHKTTILAYVLLNYETAQEELLDLDFIEALSNIIIVAIENKKLARKQQQQEALKAQLEIAKDVQSLLFPKKLPYTDRLKVVADYLPHHSVGGDYYDFIEIDKNKFLLCIADVSGKGVPAAILMSNFQAALRTLVRKGAELRHIIEELNWLIMQNSRGENYITAFFLEYDFVNQSITYVNAGHNPPFLFTSEHSCHLLKEGTTVLGGFKTLPFLNISILNSLDHFLLFCFTDGFTETYNEKGEEFGVEQLQDFLTTYKHTDQKELHKSLIKHLHQFKGRNAYIDDITLLSCSVNKIE